METESFTFIWNITGFRVSQFAIDGKTCDILNTNGISALAQHAGHFVVYTLWHMVARSDEWYDSLNEPRRI